MFKVTYPTLVLNGIPVGPRFMAPWPTKSFDTEVDAVLFIQELTKEIRSHATLHEIIRKEIDWKAYKKVKK